MATPEHTTLDGSVLAFYGDIPDGTEYYMDRRWRDDPGGFPHTKGEGADDKHRRYYGHDMPVIVHKWPEEETP